MFESKSTLSELQHLLLALLSPAAVVEQSSIDALTSRDWQLIRKMIRQHRLEPMLHWQIQKHRSSLSIPADIRAECLAAYQFQSMRALEAQRELILIHRHLEKAGIAYQALKGAYLALYAYPEPGLRPMRDLDILVPREQALQAFDCMLEHIAVRMDAFPGDPAAALEFGHHLPPLASISQRVIIEIHPVVFHPHMLHEGLADLSAPEKYWNKINRLPTGKDLISYIPPDELLINLIVHAVREHSFDNGPLLLSDLAYLIDSGKIDWVNFWDIAQRADEARASLLALRMMEYYWGDRPEIWTHAPEAPTAIPDEIILKAARLMLRDFETKGYVNLLSTAALRNNSAARIAFWLGRLFPSRVALAAMYPVRQDSVAVFLYYPRQWWRIIRIRIPELLNSVSRKNANNELQELKMVNKWLDGSRRTTSDRVPAHPQQAKVK